MSEVTSESAVTLQRITSETLPDVLALSVTEAQQAFVANNTVSLAQANFDDGAWFRAIYAGEVPVGFVMLHDESLCAEPREPGYFYLWRLMIDQRYQGIGLGRRAVRLLIAHIKTRPQPEKLHVSWEQAEGNAAGFYEKLGFKATGVKDGEIQAYLDL